MPELLDTDVGAPAMAKNTFIGGSSFLSARGLAPLETARSIIACRADPGITSVYNLIMNQLIIMRNGSSVLPGSAKSKTPGRTSAIDIRCPNEFVKSQCQQTKNEYGWEWSHTYVQQLNILYPACKSLLAMSIKTP